MPATDHEKERVDLLQWAEEVLRSKNVRGIANIQDVALTSYSYVLKFSADNDIYYLKKTPANLFIEAKILDLLQRAGQSDLVSPLIAADQSRNCFLMKSCGDQTLRMAFSGSLNFDLIVQGVENYKKIQKDAVSEIQKFIDLGVPDWRLNKLSGLYSDFVDDDKGLNLMGLTSLEKAQLRDKKDFFSDLCHELAAYNIDDSINHSDFQENNMVIDDVTGKISIIDWGEVTIGNPLLSITGCLKRLSNRYDFDVKSLEYKKMLSRFYSGWGISEKDIIQVSELVSKIDSIYYILTLRELIRNSENSSSRFLERMKSACVNFISMAV